MRRRTGNEYRKLQPYVVEEIRKLRLPRQISVSGGGGGGGGVTIHALDSGYHTGVLADAQAPQFLKMDGSRALTGNLTVSSGITIDTVDISAHAANPDAHHNRATSSYGITVSPEQVVSVNLHSNSGLQFNGIALQIGTTNTITAAASGGVSSSTHGHAVEAYTNHKTNPGHLVKSTGAGRVDFATVSTDTLTADNHITIDPVGDVLFPQAQQVRTSVFTPGIPIQGWWIGQYSSGGVASTTRNAMQIYSLTVDELRARTFVVDEVRVDRGEEFVTKSYGIVARNFTTPGAISGTVTVYFEDSPAIAGAIFSTGDFLVFRIFDQSGGGLTIANFIFTVSGYTAQPNNEQSWTLTLVEGITGYEIIKGNVGWDFGVSGQGYIHSSVVDTSGSPYMDIRTWTGTHPFEATIDTHVRIGFLITSLDNVMSPTGWGLFSDNVFLRGDLYVAGGDIRILEGDGINISISDTTPTALSEPLAIEWWRDISNRSGAPAAKTMVYQGGSSPNYDTTYTNIIWPAAAGNTFWNVRVLSSVPNTESAISIVSPDSGGNNGQAVIQAQQVLIGRTAALGGTDTQILSPTLKTFHVRPFTDVTSDLGTASFRYRVIYADQIIATTTSGTSISGQEWEYPGSMVIDANNAANTTITLTNQGTGRADVVIDRDLTVGGLINGVDITAFDARLDSVEGDVAVHTADATIHHLGGFGADQHTQYLLASGARALTGNLAVNAGITIDGVDISVLKTAYDAHAAAVAAHGAVGAVVGTANTQTLSNKSLVQPTIDSFENAPHNHSGVIGGGTIAHSVLTGIGVNDHHAQSHVLATTGGLGADHTVSGLTTGMVLKATGLTTAVFVQLAHDELAGLSDDDHPIYVHISTARTITAVHTFSPAAVGAPFILGANALGQLVTGLNADFLDGANSTEFMRNPAVASLDMNGFTIFAASTITATTSLTAGAATFGYASNVLTISTSVPNDNLVIHSSFDTFDVDSAIITLGPASGGSISTFLNTVGGTNWLIGSNGSASFGADTDISFTFGRARLGYITVSDSMTLAHYDMFAAAGGNSWALRQNHLGETKINAATGQSIFLSISDTQRISWNGTRFSPQSSIAYDLGYYTTMWRTLFVAEIFAQSLVAQDVMSTIGGRIAVTPTTSLVNPVVATDGVIVVKHNNLRNGEYLYLMDAPGGIQQFEVMQIISDPTGTGPYLYVVSRAEDGTPANDWPEGSAVASLQKDVGEGYLELTSTNTVFQHLGPSLTIYSRSGTTNWNDMYPVVSLGNLDSYVGLGITYGLAIGTNLLLTPTTGFHGLVADINGLRLFSVDLLSYNGAIQTVNLSATDGSLKLGTNITNANTTTFDFVGTTGTLRVGPVGTNLPNLYWDGTDLHLRRNTTPSITLSSAGVLTLWNPVSSTAVISVSSAGVLQMLNAGTPIIQLSTSGTLQLFNKTGGEVITLDSGGNSYFSGVMTIGTSGEIRQGTGTLGSNFTGLRIWRESDIGRIGGYASNVLQWYANTDGKLYAAGGRVILDAIGLKLSVSNNYLVDSSVNFYDGSTRSGYLGAYVDTTVTSMQLAPLAVAGKDSQVNVGALAVAGKVSKSSLTVAVDGAGKANVSLVGDDTKGAIEIEASGTGASIKFNPNASASDVQIYSKLSLYNTTALIIGNPGAGTAASYSITMPGGMSTVNSGNGRELTIQAGSSNNEAGLRGGHLTLRGGAPASPATIYGDVYIADQGGNVFIGTTTTTTTTQILSVRVVHAKDVNGLDLQDDGGNLGLSILDGGNVQGGTGKYLGIRSLRALDANGLAIADDAGGLALAIVDAVLNVGFWTDTQFGSGQKVIGIANAAVTPSTNPTGGFVLYGESGAAKVRGSGGTVTTFGPSEPHCPVCGTDYMKEFDNKEYGYFAFCIKCLADELGDRPWIIREESRLN